MVLAIRYDTTTQDARSISPSPEAMAGNAVATMVWSATARNIGSMMEGKTLTNSERVVGGWPCGLGATLVPTAGPIGLSLVASFMARNS